MRADFDARWALEPADLQEIVRLYGLRQWVEQSYRQVTGALGWADWQVRSDHAVRRHWELVCCAFCFCWWAWRHGPAPQPPPVEPPTAHPLAPAVSPPASGGKWWTTPACDGPRPTICWSVALRRVQAWLAPWTYLWRWWRAWSSDPPPPALQALLDWLATGRPIDCYVR